MLHLALQLDRRVYKGTAFGSALDQIRLSGRFDSRMLVALDSYSPPQADYVVRRLPIWELRAAMVLEEDVSSTDGKFLLFKKGTVLTETWIERLRNFAKTPGIQELAYVRISGLAFIDKRTND
jgi:hypothetical protein